MNRSFTPRPHLLDSPVGRHLAGDVPDALSIPEADLPSAASIVIIGGGIAGLALSLRLWHAGLLPETIVLERRPELVGRFVDRVTALRQRVMRSPYHHHVGVESERDCELIEFARANWGALTDSERTEVRRGQAGERAVVPLDVFLGYTRHAAAAHDVSSRTRRAAVRHVVKKGERFQVVTSVGTIITKSVVWAVGEASRAIPAALATLGPHVQRWDRLDRRRPPSRAVVVGGGLSAAHLVLGLVEGGRHVDWIMRSQEVFRCTDVDQRYVRPEGLAWFRRASLVDREAILRAEQRPSIMLEFQPRLLEQEALGRLQVHRGATVTRSTRMTGHAVLSLTTGERVITDRVYVATGTLPVFSPRLLGVPVTRGTLPRLDDGSLELEGAPGAFVIGALAGLAVGPAARTIDGNRIAADRVAQALISRHFRSAS